jgi:hypothetical protein
VQVKKSSKAALLSGLVFPGIGHVFLKNYLRGSVLVLVALAALSVIVTRTFQRAMIIVDQINSGNVPVDTAAVADMVAASTTSTGTFVDNAALLALLACWLIGVIDSYRLGAAQESESL